jgi:hypothetical protein
MKAIAGRKDRNVTVLNGCSEKYDLKAQALLL